MGNRRLALLLLSGMSPAGIVSPWTWLGLQKMDRNQDGVVTMDEFLETCQKVGGSQRLWEQVGDWDGHEGPAGGDGKGPHGKKVPRRASPSPQHCLLSSLIWGLSPHPVSEQPSPLSVHTG